MTDQELFDALKDLDSKEGISLSPWELGFLDHLLQIQPPYTKKQRAKAIVLIYRHEAEQRGEQEVVVKLPKGAERYFKKR